MSILAGIDIGGTKCAVSLSRGTRDAIEILAERRFPTPGDSTSTLSALLQSLDVLVNETGMNPEAIGISCGGPLDAQAGVVLSPPNLPGWDQVDVVSPFAAQFGVPTGLENDANAGALAEWYWGAGRGLHHLVFLTFGTGMGAGLILNGALYAGTSGLAGEIGHWRLSPSGPWGFGKEGSFEGYCSGGGIARLAEQSLPLWIGAGRATNLAPDGVARSPMTAELVAKWANQGDALALEVFRESGRRLGQALALLVDLLNPELIVLGSIFGRQRHLLEAPLWEALRLEALEGALARCRVEPCGLGERIGDMASVAVALAALQADGGR